MTLAQLDALFGVDARINNRAHGAQRSNGGGQLPHPKDRVWGTVADLKQLEARSNGR
jgi:hypothetical protein